MARGFDRYGTGQHEPEEGRPFLARRGRRWMFAAWFVGTCFMFLAAWAFGRLFEPERIGMVNTVLVFPIVQGALFFLSLAWLAWIVFGPPRPER
jgi:hypothetical protein